MGVEENDGWSIFLPGLPIAADGQTLDEALDDTVRALRDYTQAWTERLRLAPNHSDNWGLVQLIEFCGYILRDQLEVSTPEFWDCVKNGTKPHRGGPPEPPPGALPLWMAKTLIEDFRIPEPEVRAMTKQQAAARIAEGYADQR